MSTSMSSESPVAKRRRISTSSAGREKDFGAGSNWVWGCGPCLSSQKAALTGRSIQVWWAGDQCFYAGTLSGFEATTQRHLVNYTDGHWELLALQFEIILLERKNDEPTDAVVSSTVQRVGNKEEGELNVPSDKTARPNHKRKAHHRDEEDVDHNDTDVKKSDRTPPPSNLHSSIESKPSAYTPISEDDARPSMKRRRSDLTDSISLGVEEESKEKVMAVKAHRLARELERMSSSSTYKVDPGANKVRYERLHEKGRSTRSSAM